MTVGCEKFVRRLLFSLINGSGRSRMPGRGILGDAGSFVWYKIIQFPDLFARYPSEPRFNTQSAMISGCVCGTYLGRLSGDEGSRHENPNAEPMQRT